jgi:glycosyltransferase involved in cell wall biosynthesis
MTNVLAIEPFYGGSHKSFIDGLIKRSVHNFRLTTLPPYFWKWRMRGAAITLSDEANELDFKPDLILASDMLSLAEFKSLYKFQIPSVLYMHENQLSYPVPESDQRDVHFGICNITSCLAADRIIWNSKFHFNSFLNELSGFLKMMPDNRPKNIAERICEKSSVIYPGVDLEEIDKLDVEYDSGPPIIVWNHRWEFDKQPDIFFEAISKVEQNGIAFQLAVLGENFQVKPQIFLEAKDRFSDKICQFGFVSDRQEYIKWLKRSRVSVSTASQENFGISAVEAAYAGASPLWPDRLSYPELLSDKAGRNHLYSDFRELVVKLTKALGSDKAKPKPNDVLKDELARFDWKNSIDKYDELIEFTSRSF